MIKVSPLTLGDLIWSVSTSILDVWVDSLHSKISKSSLHVLTQPTAVLQCAWSLVQAVFRSEPLGCFRLSV